MSISPISMNLPFQGRTVAVNDVSEIQRLGWAECFEVKQIAKELGSNLEHDLCHRVDLIQDTLIKQLPEANEQTKNILIACLKTAFLSSLVAGAILSALFLGPSVSIVLGIVACAVSILLYVTTAEDFIFPERRIQNDEPAGPWFCPNIETLRGKIAVGSLVMPIIGGLITPLVEACTQKSRWENVFAKQNEQLASVIPSYCEFYKQQGPALIAKLNEKIQGPQDRWSSGGRERWERALECVHTQIEFLQNFDPTINLN
jgi:hypothetical protein